MSQTISSAISWWSRMQPDNVALCVEGRSATYRQFDDWASRVAKMLIAEGV